MGSSTDFDILIIGSGPSGAHAAQEALASGRKVAILDVGYADDRYDKLVPAKPFSEIRRSDPDQRQYFLGQDAAAALRDQGQAGPHPHARAAAYDPRPEQTLPLRLDTFVPL